MKLFILDEQGQPKPEPDKAKWDKWFETAHRRVAFDKIGVSQVSTIFLAYGQTDDPAFWETAVLGGKYGGIKDRCAGSREQALAMHERMVERVKGQL